jgi:hypothetical protein
MSAISDIRHRHLLFRYRKKICRTENCRSDIGRILILISEFIPISDIQKIFIISAGFKPKTLGCHKWLPYFSAIMLIYEIMDVGDRLTVYSNIRYNFGLLSLQSDIGRSDIKLSPISLITDIGVSAHLWWILNLQPSVDQRVSYHWATEFIYALKKFALYFIQRRKNNWEPAISANFCCQLWLPTCLCC